MACYISNLFVSIKRICYKWITEDQTWQQAREKCLEFNGDLISIHTQAEQDLVTSELDLKLAKLIMIIF